MMQATNPHQDERETAARVFLQSCGWASAEMSLLAADASFRRYFRIMQDGKQAVLMDAPPQKEDAAAYLHVARQLANLGLSAPRILAQDLAQGFLLLEDFGDRTFTRALAEGANEQTLYDLAVDTLIALHKRWRDVGDTRGLSPYDTDRLLDEAALFVDWYLPAVGQALPAAARADYLAVWRDLLDPVVNEVSLPSVLVLRDYHVDNLMILPQRDGIAACGLLDFQDALLGAPAYDLVSLLRDARRDVPDELQARELERYLGAFPDWSPEAFQRAYWTLGAQRNTKIIGIFTRLARRDGKPRYLDHIPRLWRLFGEELARPELAPLRDWVERYVPLSTRRRPDSNPVSTGVST